jgi:hypothetical protein
VAHEPAVAPATALARSLVVALGTVAVLVRARAHARACEVAPSMAWALERARGAARARAPGMVRALVVEWVPLVGAALDTV